MQSVICGLQSAVCSLQSAVCSLQMSDTGTPMEAKTTTRTALGYLMTANFRTLKGRFTRYDFVARDNFTTGLRHVLGPFTRERHFHLQN